MKILLTGGSGFLGNVIKQKLGQEHQIISLGRDKSNTLVCDLSTSIPSLIEADIVVHAAGKAHFIPKTEKEIADFFGVNLVGTQNLLDGLQKLPRLFVFISTVAVYGIDEGLDINEDSPLAGKSPYAKSKIEAEHIVKRWGIDRGVNVVILRLPLVVAPNPPGNLGAMIESMKRGYYLRLGDGSARKSMVLAGDVAELIPRLIDKTGVFNLTDGIHPSLAQLDQSIANEFGKKIWSLPQPALKGLAKIGDLFSFFPLNSYRLSKLTQTLVFSDLKARTQLSWEPRAVLENLFKE